MKEENTLTFVERAVSEDASRYSLMKVYRDTKNYVATNGHRLHISTDLPVADPAYIDGSKDSQFPNYAEIFPKNEAKAFIEFTLSAEQYNRLKLQVKSAGRNGNVELKFEKLRLAIHTKELSPSWGEMETTLKLAVNDEVSRGQIPILRLNAEYFLEALPVTLKGDYHKITLSYWGEVQICRIEHKLGSAYVMPLRA